jgi:hypothetical protein
MLESGDTTERALLTTASVSEGKQMTFLLAEPDRPAMSWYLVRVPRFAYQTCS